MDNSMVNIAEFFEKVWKSYEQKIATHNSYIEEIKKKNRELRGLKARLEYELEMECELEKKKHVKQQASEHVLDTTPLDIGSARTRVEIEAKEKQIGVEQEHANKEMPKQPYNKENFTLFLNNINNHNTSEARLLDSIQEASSLVTVSSEDLKYDHEGRIVEANINFDNEQVGSVKVSATHSRFSEDFIPQELKWLPVFNVESRSQQKADNGNKASMFIVKDTSSMLLPVPFIIKQDNSVLHRLRNGQIPDEVLPESNCAPFIFASNIIESSMKEAGNEIYLHIIYEDIFVERVRTQIVAHTRAEPRWQKNTEWPDTNSVYASIKNDLTLLVSAPWSSSIRGLMAKLKYMLENHERPKAWKQVHVDHYGLLLRTRDHTWLDAELFIDRTQQSVKQGEKIIVVPMGKYQTICKLGRMYFKIVEFKD